MPNLENQMFLVLETRVGNSQWRRQNDNWGGGEYSYMCVLLN